MAVTKIFIDNYDDAISILKDRGNLSDRQGERILHWSEEYPEAVKIVRPFLSEWLMYMDAEKHNSLRRTALSIISAQTSTIPHHVFSALASDARNGRITVDTCSSVAAAFHRFFFGLEPNEQEFVIADGDNILAYMFSSITDESLTKAADSISRLVDWLQGQFDRPGLLGALLTGGVPLAICVNLLIDSYHPVIAATTTLVWKWARQQYSAPNPDDAKDRVAMCLRHFPPFTVINRRVGDSHEEMYSIDISKCNRNEEKNRGEERSSNKYGLTFGSGQHYCLGVGSSLNYLHLLNDALSDLQTNYEVTSIRGGTGSDEGLSKVSDLSLTLQPI